MTSMEQGKMDVVVRLYPPSGKQDPLLALPLHSHVLSARSSFFAARLSQRWLPSAAQPLDSTNTSKDDAADPDAHAELFAIDIIAPRSSAVSIYKRCIYLMYVQRKDMIPSHPFSGVDDALDMLCVASEFLFKDCMDACMEYLDMVCLWTQEEEELIRSTLSALQLPHIHPDLARRLSLSQAIPADEPTHILRRTLLCALQASIQDVEVPHQLAPLDHASNLNAVDPSKPIPASSILLAWNTHFDTLRKAFYSGATYTNGLRAISRLLWLFDTLLALQVADSVVKNFAKDTSFTSSLTVFFNKNLDSAYGESEFALQIEVLLTRVLHAVVESKVLLSQVDRVIFVKTWLPICNTKWVYARNCGFATQMKTLIDSLPIMDREQFYKDWLVPNFRGNKDLLSSMWSWVGMLREAQSQLGGECSLVLASDDAHRTSRSLVTKS